MMLHTGLWASIFLSIVFFFEVTDIFKVRKREREWMEKLSSDKSENDGIFVKILQHFAVLGPRMFNFVHELFWHLLFPSLDRCVDILSVDGTDFKLFLLFPSFENHWSIHVRACVGVVSTFRMHFRAMTLAYMNSICINFHSYQAVFYIYVKIWNLS